MGEWECTHCGEKGFGDYADHLPNCAEYQYIQEITDDTPVANEDGDDE